MNKDTISTSKVQVWDEMQDEINVFTNHAVMQTCTSLKRRILEQHLKSCEEMEVELKAQLLRTDQLLAKHSAQ